MTKPLTAETFINWMWEYEYQSNSSADHSAFRNRFSRQIARLNEDAYRTDQPRPLTPDAITDEMVDRAHRSLISHHGYGRILRSQVSEAITAALTEPPARPEGAEAVAVRLFQAGAAVGVKMTEEQRDELADHLAAMHVRVVAEGEN